MSGFSGDPYLLERQYNTDVSARGRVLAATAGPLTAIALKVGWTINVQRVHIHITTSAAATAKFADDNGTPVIVGISDSSPLVDSEFHWDFGPQGISLTEAKNLILTLSTTGLAFSWYVEAYMKQTAIERVPSGIGITNTATTGQQFS